MDDQLFDQAVEYAGYLIRGMLEEPDSERISNYAVDAMRAIQEVTGTPGLETLRLNSVELVGAIFAQALATYQRDAAEATPEDGLTYTGVTVKITR